VASLHTPRLWCFERVMNLNKLANPFMAWLLRSPLHGLLSKNFVLLTIKGRKTGNEYTLPVNYVQVGDSLMVTSLRSRHWWRNLRGGATLTMVWRGMRWQARGEAIADDRQAVADTLYSYLQMVPQSARYFEVALDESGRPRREDVDRVAPSRVMVRITPQKRCD
jgi:hypothetical protein